MSNYDVEGGGKMKYVTTITVTVEAGGTTDIHEFENENVDITRASHLWFKNTGEIESDFIETVKMWNKMDKNTGVTTFYKFKTSEPTPVISSTTYTVDSISEDEQYIRFKEV